MTDTMMESAPGQALARKIATEDLATVLLARTVRRRGEPGRPGRVDQVGA